MENLCVTSDAVLVFYAIARLPICGKSMGLLPIDFPYIGKHMGTNTTQCTIGFPEVKIALS